MENIGERLVGDYLSVIKNCDFIAYNVHTPGVQGEIDVVGIDTAGRKLYICEVTTHLVTGMLYVHPVTKKPDNVQRICAKFAKDIEYARQNFPDFEASFMLWSPIVRASGSGAQHSQMTDLADIRSALLSSFGVEIEIVCNQDYWERVQRLRDFAARETKELKSPVLRLFQIEEKLKRHLVRGTVRTRRPSS